MDFIRNMNNPARVQDYIFAQRDRKAEDLARSLPHDMLLRIAYVPYVIARIVWDYTDTILTTAAYMKIQRTKPLCRKLRELRRQYDRIYRPHIDDGHILSEKINADRMEDEIESTTRTLLINLSTDITNESPGIDDDNRLFIEAVQQCHILLKALLLYTERQTEKAEKYMKCEMGHILPEPIYELSRLIPKFSEGIYCISERFVELRKNYIRTFANQFATVEFRKESLKITEK